MKKHDEGYALVLVLIVLTVLGLLTSIMLSFSLQHIQTQQKYIDRMQDQYTAAGEIEKVISQLQSQIGSETASVNLEGAEVSTEEQTVKITAGQGMVQIVCTIQLTAEDMEEGNIAGQYIIKKLTAVTYTSYELNTQEVTPDA